MLVYFHNYALIISKILIFNVLKCYPNLVSSIYTPKMIRWEKACKQTMEKSTTINFLTWNFQYCLFNNKVPKLVLVYILSKDLLFGNDSMLIADADQ